MQFNGPFALCVLLICAASVLAAPLNAAEHAALMAVFNNSTPPLPSHEFGYPRFAVDEECRRGVVCSNGTVVVLRLLQADLTSMATQLGQLSSLTDLILHDNKLTSVPTEIGRLTSLVHL